MLDNFHSTPTDDDETVMNKPFGTAAVQAEKSDVRSRNEDWLRQRFAEDRDMAADYLRASATYPWLFRSLDLPSLVGHVEGVVGHFSGDGLSREQYLGAVATYPPLALQKAAVVIDNIEQVLERYGDDGLSRSDYLQAAVDQPMLFHTNPQAVIDNITDLEEWLAGPVSGTADCLRKAVDRPRLFICGVDALPSLAISPISGAREPAAAAHVGRQDVETPCPDGGARVSETVPTTEVSAPVIQKLTRVLLGRSQAA
jgi:hypothetical protein